MPQMHGRLACDEKPFWRVDWQSTPEFLTKNALSFLYDVVLTVWVGGE
jgi:hypothetical protein